MELHGGNIYKASKEYGIDVDKIIDFSANINALGIPKKMRELLAVAEDGLVNNYPDIECTELKEGISKYLDVPVESIIVGNGAIEIIFLLLEVLRPNNVLIPAPTFCEYEKAAKKYGSKIHFYRLTEKNSFNIDVDNFLKCVDEEIDCVVLCNPNNPTSTLTCKQDLAILIKAFNAAGKTVVIDESFIELTIGGNNNSAVEYIRNYDNLFLIRGFTKIFAVPGIRLGYGIGSKEIVQKMWEYKLPWSVNSIACKMGSLLSEEQGYLEKTQIWLKEEINWFYNELIKFDEIKVFEPKSNFILAKILIDNMNSDILKDLMAQKGILVRNAGNFKFLDNSFFRIAVKDRKSNLRFIKVLREIIKNN